MPLNSRKPSNRSTNLALWKHFSIWSHQKGVSPERAFLDLRLDYLLYLNQSLAVSSVREHLAAISTFHVSLDSKSPFSNPTITRFLKDLIRLYLLVQEPIPSWNQNVVLAKCKVIKTRVE